MSTAEQYFSDGTFRVDPYSKPRVAELSNPTMAGLQGLQSHSTVAPMALDSYQALLSNDGFRGELDAVKQGVMDDTKASLAGMFSGQFGNSLAAPAATEAMAKAIAPMEYDALMNNRSMQASLVGMAPTMENVEFSDANRNLQAGNVLDAFNQRQIAADMDAYYEGQSADSDALSRYSAFATGIGGMGGSSTSTASQRAGLGGIIGGGLQLAGLFSDRRLKEDIVKIGETYGGTAIYKFRYKGDPVFRIGPMADEVPEAVIGEVQGFSVVDYGKVS